MGGNFYGTTAAGGQHDWGVVFKWAPNSKIITTVAYFNWTDGANPSTTMVQDTSGDLFGTTTAGGANQQGGVFELPVADPSTIKLVASFIGPAPASTAGLAIDTAGNLFGTTVSGETANMGEVYQVVGGNITPIASINNPNSPNPDTTASNSFTGLWLDGSGNLWGTTFGGGVPGARDGTVFEVKGASKFEAPNWSGYVAESNMSSPQPGAVTEVSGTWTVPEVSGKNTALLGTWVGIDGAGGDSKTIEQIGTLEYMQPNGMPFYQAIYQMFPGPIHDIPLEDFPVSSGTEVSASVTYNPPPPKSGAAGTFTLTITNLTTKVSWSPPQPLVPPDGLQAQRQSAEWIVEDAGVAPPNTSPTGYFPLPNFDTVTFTSAWATINGVTGPINDPAWQYQQINMVSNGGDVEALTSGLVGGESVTPKKGSPSFTSSDFSVKYESTAMP